MEGGRATVPPKVKTVYIYYPQKVEQGSDLIIFTLSRNTYYTCRCIRNYYKQIPISLFLAKVGLKMSSSSLWLTFTAILGAQFNSPLNNFIFENTLHRIQVICNLTYLGNLINYYVKQKCVILFYTKQFLNLYLFTLSHYLNYSSYKPSNNSYSTIGACLDKNYTFLYLILI